MENTPTLWQDPARYLGAMAPDDPVYFFRPAVLQKTARRFIDGFPGLVSYAVKANDSDMVLQNLSAAGICTFDVASPLEMEKVRRAIPDAVLHYNNPVRSEGEIAAAKRFGVASWSVDEAGELEKLKAANLPPGTEVAVRLKLDVAGAAYDFGEKFGADGMTATHLLRSVVDAGFVPAMTFHPGTQCEDASAWNTYIAACAKVSLAAGVDLHRLNVGGGFPAQRAGRTFELEKIFETIRQSVRAHFGSQQPEICCEPGRAMVAESFLFAARIKSMRGSTLYLNDGIYGALSEAPVMDGVPSGARAIGHNHALSGELCPWRVFGPTCDSLDQLPGTLCLPKDLAEDDYVLFQGLGAYSLVTGTGFNGYGRSRIVTLGPDQA